MGLPQLDFRVPEATWFKSALSGLSGLSGKIGSVPGVRSFGSMPGLNTTGALAWPYKIAVVAVMALVACGTLVTFGSAGAETPSSAEVAALPGTDEASPSVEGQVLPPTSPALLNSADLLSSLNLMDYSPGDTTLSLTDDNDDEDSDENSDEKTKASIKKKLATSKPTTKPTTSPTTSSPTPKPTTSSPSTPAPTPTKTTAPPPSPEPSPSPTKTCKWQGEGLLKKWVCS